ncbi:MAG: DUF374 domain-containing protein [Rickettsiales bacterium]|nr:DUF374 domain-containing protein [Rickettsiales bacterium]
MTDLNDIIKNKILKNTIVRSIACWIVSLYIKLVFYTSKVKIIGYTEEYLNLLMNNKSTFVMTWHGKILIAPMIVKTLLKRINYTKQPCVLSSKHRDGQIASKIMKFFNFKEIFGSTINRDKLDKAEESGAVKSIMIIMREIKSGSSIHLAPDGPRGPVRKINSKIVDIAKKTSTPIFPVSINYYFKKQLRSWDEFQIPLPFGKIVVEYMKPLYTDKNSNVEESNLILENSMNTITTWDK